MVEGRGEVSPALSKGETTLSALVALAPPSPPMKGGDWMVEGWGEVALLLSGVALASWWPRDLPPFTGGPGGAVVSSTHTSKSCLLWP